MVETPLPGQRDSEKDKKFFSLGLHTVDDGVQLSTSIIQGSKWANILVANSGFGLGMENPWGPEKFEDFFWNVDLNVDLTFLVLEAAEFCTSIDTYVF